MIRSRRFYAVVGGILLISAALSAFVFQIRKDASSNLTHAFIEAHAFWQPIHAPGDVEAGRVAIVVQPFLTEEGISFLLNKCDTIRTDESRTAVLCCVVILQVIRNQCETPVFEKIRQILERSPRYAMINRYSVMNEYDLLSELDAAVMVQGDSAEQKSRKNDLNQGADDQSGE